MDGAGPSAWGDIDGDGDLDLLAQGCDTYLAFYRNDGTQFVDISSHIGLKDVDSGFSGNLVDYDNDGDLDLYIARSGWSGPGPNALYRNDGGQFTDVSAASGTNDGGSGLSPCGAIRITMATWIYLSQMALPETAPQTRTIATMETEHLSKPQTKRAFILTWAR